MNSTPSIQQLQSDWARLSDLDRAKAVHAIHKAGSSIRRIASQLDCSESLLRHLLIALDAPVEDRALAVQGKISTNELVRRAGKARHERASRDQQEFVHRQAKAAQKAAKNICDWLIRIQLNGASGEAVIGEVRREFAIREQIGTLHKHPGKLHIPTKELIERCKPKRPIDDNATYIRWYQEWLCRWAFFAFPDSDVRDKALEIALERQWNR